MRRKNFSTLILLVSEVLLVSTVTLASELQPGKTQEGMLRDGKGPTYTVMLKTGDYVEADADLRNTELIITVYDPAGIKFRAFRLDEDYGSLLRFVAEKSGTYRLEIAGKERSKTGNFSLTLRIVPLEERLTPTPAEPYESARIKQLKADLSAGKPDAVARFWEEARARTTPLLEPFAPTAGTFWLRFCGRATKPQRTSLWNCFLMCWRGLTTTAWRVSARRTSGTRPSKCTGRQGASIVWSPTGLTFTLAEIAT